MQEIKNLLNVVKKELRLRGLSYRDVAKALELSEPSVKRLFSDGRLSLERLAQIANLMGLSLTELVQQADLGRPQLRQLSVQQETELVSDPQLLLVAVCALNHWTVSEMTECYRLSEAQCIAALLRLDRLGLITLLPGNRVRLRVARDFDWLPDGPIRRYFREEGQDDFLGDDFGAAHASHVFISGMLTEAASDELHRLLHALRRRFEQLHQDGLGQSLARRHGTALLLATRRWEPPAFKRMRRGTGNNSGKASN